MDVVVYFVFKIVYISVKRPKILVFPFHAIFSVFECFMEFPSKNINVSVVISFVNIGFFVTSSVKSEIVVVVVDVVVVVVVVADVVFVVVVVVADVVFVVVVVVADVVFVFFVVVVSDVVVAFVWNTIAVVDFTH